MNNADALKLRATIYVGGIAREVGKETIRQAFLPFGDIVLVDLPLFGEDEGKTGHRGYAFVEFEEPEDAREAIDNMDLSELYGKTLRVSKAKDKKKELEEGLNSEKAVWQQEGWLKRWDGNAEKDIDEEGKEQDVSTSKPDAMQGLEISTW